MRRLHIVIALALGCMAGSVEASDFAWSSRLQLGVRYFGSPQGVATGALSGSMWDTVKLRGEWAHRYETQTRDLSVSVSPVDSVTLSTGYQIEKWGVADFLRGVDALNPLDLRDPGRLELNDVRLGLWVTKLAYQNDTLRLEALAIHQTQPDYVDRVSGVPGGVGYDLNSTGLGLRGVLSVDQFEFELSSLDHLDPVRRHRLGAAAQYLLGQTTLKAEVAQDEAEDVVLAGVDWVIDDNHSLVAEVNRRTDRLGLLPVIDSHAIMYRWDSDSDTVHLSWLASGNHYFVSTHRIQVVNDFSDQVSGTLGVLLVNNGRDFFRVPYTYDNMVFGVLTVSVL